LASPRAVTYCQLHHRPPTAPVLPGRARPPLSSSLCLLFFFFNDTATTDIYPLSLHDALPILHGPPHLMFYAPYAKDEVIGSPPRSEEHTSELQSLTNLVCRLLLEKKNEQEPEQIDSPAAHRAVSAPDVRAREGRTAPRSPPALHPLLRGKTRAATLCLRGTAGRGS